MNDSGRGLAAFAMAMLIVFCVTSCSSERTVILATGTTPYDAGLLDVLEPLFEDGTGYELKVIAVGTGQALEMARRGDADVVFAHDPIAEEQFVEDGYGTGRQFVMYNDFVIVGPVEDPVGLRRAENALTALHGIVKSQLTFISRADDSGTYALEQSIWKELNIDPTDEAWYDAAGQGMGATLQIASQRGGYTISDRGTFLALKDTLDLDILFEGDPTLTNVYHVMAVDPDVVEGVNFAGATAFVDFMVSSQAQALIAQFGAAEHGEPLFKAAVGQEQSGVR